MEHWQGETQNPYTKDRLLRSVWISLFSWARDDNVKPFRGWIGDNFGVKIGSRLWTINPSKITDDTLRIAKEMCDEALAWMIEDGLAKSVDVIIERDGVDRINILVTITKNDGKIKEIRFDNIWGDND